MFRGFVLAVILIAVALGALVAVILGIVAFAVSNDDGGTEGPVDFDLAAIRVLSSSAKMDADNMDLHADAMVAASAGRTDRDQWAKDADLLRAEARSLRFLADSAQAIERDLTQFPPGGNAVDLGRVLGNGENLQSLGETLGAHATAMQGQVDNMRLRAGGDSALLDSLIDLSQDVQTMQVTGGDAVNAGKALADRAWTLARSLGLNIE